MAKYIQNLAYNAHLKSQRTKSRNKIYKGSSLQGVILSREHILYTGRDMRQKRDGKERHISCSSAHHNFFVVVLSTRYSYYYVNIDYMYLKYFSEHMDRLKSAQKKFQT